MELQILKALLIFVVFQLKFAKTQAEDISPNVDCLEILLHSNCQLNMTEESTRLINGNLSNPKTTFVRLNPIVRPYSSDEFWRTENKSDKIGKYFWVWADDDIGRQYLHLDYNFVEMSLWTLSPGVEKINIDLHEVQEGCWVTLNVTEQFCTLASLFLETIHEMAGTQHRLQDSVICYTKTDFYYMFATVYKPSSYQCADISNVTNLKFSLEDTSTWIWDFSALRYTVIGIAAFYFPLFCVLFFPEILTTRYSQKMQANMKNFEINSSKAQTPLSELFSPGNRMSAVLGMCIFTYPLANIAVFYQNVIDIIYYKDCTETYAYMLPFICILFVVFILVSLYSAMLPAIEFEECKTKINHLANYRFNKVRFVLRLESKIQNIDCTISSYLGDYVSLENNMKNSLLGALDLLKELKEDVGSRFNLRNAPLSLLRLIGGLLIIPFVTAPLITVMFGGAIPLPSNTNTNISPGLKKLSMSYLDGLTMICFALSASVWMSILTMTLIGTIINYDIVLPYIILALSVLYYVCHPFYALQEKYLVLKAIVFRECSSLGPKYIKYVPVNAISADVSDSHAILKNRVAPLLECCNAEFSLSSRATSVNPRNVADDNASMSPESPPPPEQDIYFVKGADGSDSHVLTNNEEATMSECALHRVPSYTSSTPSFLRSITEESIAVNDNVQATGSRPLPSPEQDIEQYIMLYKSDDNGLESIPKELWVSIYKKLIPLDVGIIKACITSIATVTMAIVLMLAVVNFRGVSELQLSGQGIVSFITASIPKFVLGFFNSEGSKEALKRSWEVTVRETVDKYIKDNEILNQRSVE